MKIVYYQLYIKSVQITPIKQDVAQRKIKKRKAVGLMKYHQKYGRQGYSTVYRSDTAMS